MHPTANAPGLGINVVLENYMTLGLRPANATERVTPLEPDLTKPVAARSRKARQHQMRTCLILATLFIAVAIANYLPFTPSGYWSNAGTVP